MKCEKCGKEINEVMVNLFDCDGADAYHKLPIDEDGTVAIIETTQNWTGYDLSEEEMTETICCPHCKQFPFVDKNIDVYDVVRVVCFKTEIKKGEN